MRQKLGVGEENPILAPIQAADPFECARRQSKQIHALLTASAGTRANSSGGNDSAAHQQGTGLTLGSAEAVETGGAAIWQALGLPHSGQEQGSGSAIGQVDKKSGYRASRSRFFL